MVRGFWYVAQNPMRRMRFRTRSRLIEMPTLAKYSTNRRLPLQGSSRQRASILAMMRNIDARIGVGR